MLALMLQPEAAGGPVEKIALTFGVDWPHLTAQFISFAIVCVALYWLAYQPVLRMLEARRQQIALVRPTPRRSTPPSPTSSRSVRA